MRQVAELIDRVLAANGDTSVSTAVRDEVRALCAEFPLPH